MSGNRIAVITGASAGVGLAAAKALAAEGWRVIGLGRNAARCAAAEAELRASAPGAEVTMLRADLSLMADAARVAKEIAGMVDHVDLLANNAGGMIPEPAVTAEGLEECFAGNHLGPFVLTTRLLPLLLKAPQPRVINTSSDGSEMIPGMNWENLEDPLGSSPGAAYCSGKLANVMFAAELARRHGGQGLLAFSFHPGTVASNFFAHVPQATRAHTEALEKITPEEGAATLLWLARQPAEALDNGGYYYRCAPRDPNPTAHDPANGERLWALSEQLVASALARS
ncbi:SDR family NAD(P)-dependent oxidoreductase [Novosphingobium sp. TH158]|uniref:SDR family NAD(P)-dependent oxidoreductase n=1 Tax=Novosphingobium sp. TH158 TaxID=2067455 RepID=UPI000C7D3AE2|nr:SDR family NAD(P)-dependent oxidoreductase [Novosphingobium sp. TH158]PLK27612.1 short-chain dehydrogenase [Novosphingobium sp. TH158]